MLRTREFKATRSRSVLILLIAIGVAVFMIACSETGGGGKISISPTPVAISNVQQGLEDFKGKVVILDFWATWCGPCRSEIPGFVRLQEKYRDKGLEIIGVSVDPIFPQGGPGAAGVEPFMKSNKINYTIWMVHSEDAIRGYNVGNGIPMTYVIDRGGNIVRSYLGAKPIQVFENDINTLL
jgi:thiol-disulfide isomerase/thioredoxin